MQALKRVVHKLFITSLEVKQQQWNEVRSSWHTSAQEVKSSIDATGLKAEWLDSK